MLFYSSQHQFSSIIGSGYLSIFFMTSFALLRFANALRSKAEKKSAAQLGSPSSVSRSALASVADGGQGSSLEMPTDSSVSLQTSGILRNVGKCGEEISIKQVCENNELATQLFFTMQPIDLLH